MANPGTLTTPCGWRLSITMLWHEAGKLLSLQLVFTAQAGPAAAPTTRSLHSVSLSFPQWWCPSRHGHN